MLYCIITHEGGSLFKRNENVQVRQLCQHIVGDTIAWNRARNLFYPWEKWRFKSVMFVYLMLVYVWFWKLLANQCIRRVNVTTIMTVNHKICSSHGHPASFMWKPREYEIFHNCNNRLLIEYKQSEYLNQTLHAGIVVISWEDCFTSLNFWGTVNILAEREFFIPCQLSSTCRIGTISVSATTYTVSENYASG